MRVPFPPPSLPTFVEMLNILAINEMQIKTRLRFHLTPVRMTILKNPLTTNVEYILTQV
jgi:hypothetical protein